MAAQEREKALVELARFRRQRREPFGFGQNSTPNPGYNRAGADEVLPHRFTVGDIPHHFEGAIDWSFNPTTVAGSTFAADPEWTWRCHRHGAWSTLAIAYTATGDERYAREFAAELASWLHDCPVPQGKAWQCRLGGWSRPEPGGARSNPVGHPAQEFGFKTSERFDCARGVYEDGFGASI